VVATVAAFFVDFEYEVKGLGVTREVVVVFLSDVCFREGAREGPVLGVVTVLIDLNGTG
jgi:hypothetical protein